MLAMAGALVTKKDDDYDSPDSVAGDADLWDDDDDDEDGPKKRKQSMPAVRPKMPENIPREESHKKAPVFCLDPVHGRHGGRDEGRQGRTKALATGVGRRRAGQPAASADQPRSKKQLQPTQTRQRW